MDSDTLLSRQLIFILVSISALFGTNALVSAQSNKGKCNVAVSKTYSQSSLGVNIGYCVELINRGSLTVDAVEWSAKFYNKFGDLKEVKEGSWSSGNFIKPAKSGEKFIDVEPHWVQGATDVFITIKRVHFIDGTTCN